MKHIPDDASGDPGEPVTSPVELGQAPAKASFTASVIHVLLIVAAVGVGGFGPLGGGINVAFANKLGSGVFSSFIAFSMNYVVFIIARIVELRRQNTPLTDFVRLPRSIDGAGKGPHWSMYFLPGFFGDVFVLSTVFLLPELGFAFFFVVVVSTSMVCAVVVDHVGFLGGRVLRVNRWSGLGLAVAIVGECAWHTASS